MRIENLALFLAAAAAACSGGGATSSGGTTSGSGGSSTHSDTTSVTVTTTTTTSGGGMGGSGGCMDMGPVSTTFVPTANDIQFHALHPLPQGEQIIFDNWAPNPNTVSSMTPDGATTTQIFAAYRVWSMGVSSAGDKIAFACGDPQQTQHYQGLALGDAIQHTWLYDAATQTATLLADGNINDECHVFGPGDTSIFLCRRYDFTTCFDNKGYRVGKIDLPGGAFTWLTPEDPTAFSLEPAPLADGSAFLFALQAPKGGSYETDLEQEPLPTGNAAQDRANAGAPVLSRDGARYVYANYADGGDLWVSNLDGSGAVQVSGEPGVRATWSPDGSKIAYLAFDQAHGCSNIEVVASDGSTAGAPKRIRDCSLTGEAITEIQWIKR